MKGLLMENDTNNTDNMSTPAPAARPLGYWLRAVDGLIAAEFHAAFAADDASRRDWRILNLLDGDVDAPGLVERLQRGKKLRALADRGWIAEVDGRWTLTDEGRAAKERLAAIVGGVREKVAGSVSAEDFATTIASLEAIARTLGWDENTAGVRGPFGRRGFGRRGFGPDDRRGFAPGGRRGVGHHPHHEHAEHCGHDGRGGEHRRGERGGRHSERSFERGFDAGFARGREAETRDAHTA